MDGQPPQMQSTDDGIKTKLAAMRTSLIDQDVPLQGIDDAMLARFLRARAMHVPRAAKMLAEHQRWRASFVPLGFISESEVESELAQGKVSLQGVSKKTGHPLLIMLARHHVANKADPQEFKRFVVYVFDKLIASGASGDVEQHIVIVDLEGVGYKNMDVKSLLTALHICQNYYPERLVRLYFVKAPSIFSSFWKMASPFLDKVTREKIIFLDANKTIDFLLKEFDVDIIPKEYGGKAELILIQDACVQNWLQTNSSSSSV
ncbi:hypothetical protein GOP47_0008685 [Adiantum capillus-veneris]|uniref:CRAL-TRIO domain-containing protein n=1 Tax=Adiantum capillus-veneris TaxID=13818 RepID=A0A9D4UYT6_ADICA|nr:hypothetical protein GOP47_0008685 [Adiantum capillus-veneris]